VPKTRLWGSAKRETLSFAASMSDAACGVSWPTDEFRGIELVSVKDWKRVLYNMYTKVNLGGDSSCVLLCEFFMSSIADVHRDTRFTFAKKESPSLFGMRIAATFKAHAPKVGARLGNDEDELESSSGVGV
jgi:hypothetical protein